jgi:hypothetical protein
MQKTKAQFGHHLLRIVLIAFLAGLAIFIIYTAFHVSGEEPTNHPCVFAEYANSDAWIAAHIG